jgi:hypothetical protein
MVGRLQVGQATGQFDGFPDGFVWFFITYDGNERGIHLTSYKRTFTTKDTKNAKGIKGY